jgi:hypothetical protein
VPGAGAGRVRAGCGPVLILRLRSRQELGSDAAAACADRRPQRIKEGTAEWARAQLVQRNTSGIA